MQKILSDCTEVEIAEVPTQDLWVDRGIQNLPLAQPHHVATPKLREMDLQFRLFFCTQAKQTRLGSAGEVRIAE